MTSAISRLIALLSFAVASPLVACGEDPATQDRILSNDDDDGGDSGDHGGDAADGDDDGGDPEEEIGCSLAPGCGTPGGALAVAFADLSALDEAVEAKLVALADACESLADALGVDVGDVPEGESDAARVTRVCQPATASAASFLVGDTTCGWLPAELSACELACECDRCPARVDDRAACGRDLIGRCGGTCHGTCVGAPGVPVECDGACDGLCTGDCEGTDVSGQPCDGWCQGHCEGRCEYSEAGFHCSAGVCDGACDANVEEPLCTGEPAPHDGGCVACSEACALRATAATVCAMPVVTLDGAPGDALLAGSVATVARACAELPDATWLDLATLAWDRAVDDAGETDDATCRSSGDQLARRLADGLGAAGLPCAALDS